MPEAAAKSQNLSKRKKNVEKGKKCRYQIFAISQTKFADDITSVYLPQAVKITKLKAGKDGKKETFKWEEEKKERNIQERGRKEREKERKSVNRQKERNK